jgi:hypothetical protein
MSEHLTSSDEAAHAVDAVVQALRLVHGKDNADAMLAQGVSVGDVIRVLRRVEAARAQAVLKRQGISPMDVFVFHQSEMATFLRRARPQVIATVLAALQSGTVAVYPDRGPVRSLARPATAQAGGTESEYYDRLHVITDNHPPQPVAEVFMVHRSVGQTSKTAAEEKPQRKLPAKPPKGFGYKGWRVVHITLNLRRGTHRLLKQTVLLEEVNKVLALESADPKTPETASKTLLKDALMYLREKRLIDH